MTKTIRNDSMKTENDDVKQAISKIMADVYETLTPKQLGVIGQTLQLIAANGCPVTPDEIATHLQASPDKVRSTLNKLGAEFDQEGKIVGVGLTLIPTPHVYEVNGQKLYVWCAADALAFPVILKQTARIESPDPVTGKKIQVIVTPDKIDKIEPKTAVVSFIKNIDITNIRDTFCNKVNFFSSPETASEWAAKHPKVMFYPANDIYQALKHIHLNKYHDIMIQSSKQEQRMYCC
jgi:alkylmercury lyase